MEIEGGGNFVYKVLDEFKKAPKAIQNSMRDEFTDLLTETQDEL
jgi:hypothetical protein